jgi:benzodiazapine receptor
LEFLRMSTTAGLLLLPYILWVSFAAILNYSIFIMNP